MHNGSVTSLTELLTLLETGGHDFPNKSEEIKSFKLSAQERVDLLHFFEALTDEQLKN